MKDRVYFFLINKSGLVTLLLQEYNNNLLFLY